MKICSAIKIEDLISPGDISLIEGLELEHLYFVYPGEKLHQIGEKITKKWGQFFSPAFQQIHVSRWNILRKKNS